MRGEINRCFVYRALRLEEREYLNIDSITKCGGVRIYYLFVFIIKKATIEIEIIAGDNYLGIFSFPCCSKGRISES